MFNKKSTCILAIFCFLSFVSKALYAGQSLSESDVKLLVNNRSIWDGQIRELSDYERQVWILPAYYSLKIADVNGVPRIGKYNVKSLLKKLSQIRVFANYSTTPLLGQNGRSGSIYLVEQKIIIFNISVLQSVLAKKDQSATFGVAVMFLHEMLSVLGVPDENSEASTNLVLLSRAQELGLKPDEIESIKFGLSSHFRENSSRIANLKHTTEGGSTGVGGGGDPRISEVKIYLLKGISQLTNLNKKYKNLLMQAATAQPLEVLKSSSSYSSNEILAPMQNFPGFYWLVRAHQKRAVIVFDPDAWDSAKRSSEALNKFITDLFGLVKAANSLICDPADPVPPCGAKDLKKR